MRASPACQVSLQRFGAWRIAVVTLALLGAATLAGWLLGREGRPVEWWWGAATSLVLMLLLAASLWRVPVQDLRWDGQRWYLGESPGDLRVAIDPGPWMLLRFMPSDSVRTRWLPVQRRGLEAAWHLLRCAVYSPRPVAER